MTEVVRRERVTVQVCHLENGWAWGDMFPTEGEFAGVCVCSSEGRSPLTAMLDLSRRMYAADDDQAWDAVQVLIDQLEREGK